MIALIIWAWPVWRSLLIAALLAYLLRPLVSRLERRWPGKRAIIVVVVYFGLLLILFGLISIVGTVVWNNAQDWAAELQTVWVDIREWLKKPVTILSFTIQPELLVDYLQEAGANAFTEISLGTQNRLLGFTDNLLWIFVIAISFYYLLRDGHTLNVLFLRRLPRRYRPHARELLAEIDDIWGTFLRVQLIIFAVIGFLVVLSTTLILWMYRQEWLPLSPLGLIIVLILTYSAVTQVDNLWLRPKYMGQSLRLHPGVSLIALLSAFALTGVIGALVVIPVLATLKVLAGRLPRLVFPEIYS